ncbi:hypothetical protein OTK49_01270 [Vibrio coralliirubri]|uniref:hypothetical protein n=1 Tax=Vibrio coralliirubri TaxID=1516159 RepID=UPI0022852D92|nr:hypothetical protein [Vibrio coralliirubri]MCY9861159.1 hypothetical protein [Vibrio coralliirubri]
MKFNSPFYFGQLVTRAIQLKSIMSDDFARMEVLEICFGIDGDPVFLCEDIKTGVRQHYTEKHLMLIDTESGHYQLESNMGLREIVIRESHQNGEMVQERMMEVVCVIFLSDDTVHYVCEDTYHGNRQVYSESMLVGDPDFDQEEGKYPVTPESTEHTNAIPAKD